MAFYALHLDKVRTFGAELSPILITNRDDFINPLLHQCDDAAKASISISN
jgi:hypothetical protein